MVFFRFGEAGSLNDVTASAEQQGTIWFSLSSLGSKYSKRLTQYRPQSFFEGLRRKQFGNQKLRACISGLQTHLRGRFGSNKTNLHITRVAQLGQKLQSIHFRHVPIGKHQIRRFAGNNLERFASTTKSQRSTFYFDLSSEP